MGVIYMKRKHQIDLEMILGKKKTTIKSTLT